MKVKRRGEGGGNWVGKMTTVCENPNFEEEEEDSVGMTFFVHRDGCMRYFVALTCLFPVTYFAAVNIRRKDLQFRTNPRTHI